MEVSELTIEQKQYYMGRALELAKKGMGYTNPNPMVGCVIVKDGKIVAEGYHEKCGGFHAERNALLSCKEDVTGASAFVTLEPCCHYGKTPPCTEIIIERGIKKVYVGSMDSNPLVGGKGVKILQEAGIEVECGILKEECDKLNEIFFHYIEHKTPFVAMKYAQTLDGKIACSSGDSKWITNEVSRNHVQELRKQYAGIMVGIGTVLADNPMLNCRIAKGADPVRIICDSTLRIPMDSNIVKTAKEIPTIVACSEIQEEDKKKQKLEEAGVTVLSCGRDNQVDLRKLMKLLGERNIDSVLVEGGSEIHGNLLKEHLIDKVYVYIAPKLVGGRNSKSPIGGDGIMKMADATFLSHVAVQQFNGDILVTGYPGKE